MTSGRLLVVFVVVSICVTGTFPAADDDDKTG